MLKPISEIKANLGIEPNGRVQKEFTGSCRRHMDKWLPFDTGALATTAIEQTDAIIYQQPYAKVVYYGVRNGKELNYSKDKHPLAGSYWDKRMVSAEIQDVVKEIQEYMTKKG